MSSSSGNDGVCLAETKRGRKCTRARCNRGNRPLNCWQHCDSEYRFAYSQVVSRDQDCSICFENMYNTHELDPSCRIDCGHIFHFTCLRQWSDSSTGITWRCPTCRTRLPLNANFDILSLSDYVPAPGPEVAGPRDTAGTDTGYFISESKTHTETPAGLLSEQSRPVSTVLNALSLSSDQSEPVSPVLNAPSVSSDQSETVSPVLNASTYTPLFTLEEAKTRLSALEHDILDFRLDLPGTPIGYSPLGYSPLSIPLDAKEIQMQDSKMEYVFSTVRRWGEYGTEDGGLQYPHTLCAYKSRVIVATGTRVCVFTIHGKFERSFCFSAAPWTCPGVRDIAVCPVGNLFVLEGTQTAIWCIYSHFLSDPHIFLRSEERMLSVAVCRETSVVAVTTSSHVQLYRVSGGGEDGVRTPFRRVPCGHVMRVGCVAFLSPNQLLLADFFGNKIWLVDVSEKAEFTHFISCDRPQRLAVFDDKSFAVTTLFGSIVCFNVPTRKQLWEVCKPGQVYGVAVTHDNTLLYCDWAKGFVKEVRVRCYAERCNDNYNLPL
jgi:hypothetical protein